MASLNSAIIGSDNVLVCDGYLEKCSWKALPKLYFKQADFAAEPHYM